MPRASIRAARAAQARDKWCPDSDSGSHPRSAGAWWQCHTRAADPSWPGCEGSSDRECLAESVPAFSSLGILVDTLFHLNVKWKMAELQFRLRPGRGSLTRDEESRPRSVLASAPREQASRTRR